MIYAFTGKTGSGKTYSMVKLAFEYWSKGYDIYSNTPLFFEKSRKQKILGLFKKKFSLTGKVRYFEDINDIIHIRNGIIMFDEAQALFNARNWEALPAEFQFKLQQHRKHGLHLFCTTQNMGAIDISYRRLVQVWEHCSCLFSIGGSPQNIIGLYRRETKDVDFLYNQVDDLKVPNISNKFFIIHYFSKKIYDTLFDIGFKRFKSHYIIDYKIDKKTLKRVKREICYIFLKNVKYETELRQYKTYSGQF